VWAAGSRAARLRAAAGRCDRRDPGTHGGRGRGLRPAVADAVVLCGGAELPRLRDGAEAVATGSGAGRRDPEGGVIAQAASTENVVSDVNSRRKTASGRSRPWTGPTKQATSRAYVGCV